MAELMVYVVTAVALVWAIASRGPWDEKPGRRASPRRSAPGRRAWGGTPPLWDDEGSVGGGFGVGQPDLLTDPAYSWLPGNIFYYHQGSPPNLPSGREAAPPSPLFEPDPWTDPTYSWMLGNIFHDDASGSCSSASPFEDSFGCGTGGSDPFRDV